MPRVGCVDLSTSEALLATCLHAPFRDLPKVIGSIADSFIGFPSLDETDVPKLTPHVPPNALIAALVHAENFDPAEDHPPNPDFGWTSILLDDFRDINDDLGTLSGVTNSHFQTQLSWRPRVDPKRTAKVAIVAPGPWNRTTIRESSALPALSRAIAESGYDAVAIACKAADDREFEVVVQYAEEIKREAGLPLLFISRWPRNIERTPFTMMVREARAWSDLENRSAVDAS